MVLRKQAAQAEVQLGKAEAALEGLVCLMSGDADIRVLSRKVNDLEGSVRRLTLAVTNLERTLSDFFQVLKKNMEEADE